MLYQPSSNLQFKQKLLTFANNYGRKKRLAT
jgi:hypothetical protein